MALSGLMWLAAMAVGLLVLSSLSGSLCGYLWRDRGPHSSVTDTGIDPHDELALDGIDDREVVVALDLSQVVFAQVALGADGRQRALV